MNTPITQADRELTAGIAEDVRLKLCSIGLHPGYHDTLEKAAAAAVEMVTYLRGQLADPPADVQSLVFRKHGVYGFTEDQPATMKLVPIEDVKPPKTAEQ